MAELIAAVYDVSRRRTVQARGEGNSYLAAMLHHLLCLTRMDGEEETSEFLNTEGFSSAATGYNRNYICTAFKRNCGFTVRTYLNYVRIFHAAEMIAYGDYTLQQVCAAVGFNDPSYFTKTFRKIVGIPPRAVPAGLPRRYLPDHRRRS